MNCIFNFDNTAMENITKNLEESYTWELTGTKNLINKPVYLKAKTSSTEIQTEGKPHF